MKETELNINDLKKIFALQNKGIEINIDDTIPDGFGKEKMTERQEKIVKHLSKFTVPIECPALDSYVMIKPKSIKETKRHASKRSISTQFALNLEEIIKNASYIKPVAKESGNKSQAIFKQLHLLICPIKGYGYAKLVIGEVNDKREDPSPYWHYCITQTSFEKVTLKK